MRKERLVRDKLPDLIKCNGATPIIEYANTEWYSRLLAVKAIEELDEFFERGDVAELVDLVEVVYAIAALNGIDEDRFNAMRVSELERRGGFNDRVVWMGNRTES